MFRFTIRDVLWLLVVVGLACGWWVHVGKLSRHQQDVIKSKDEQLELAKSDGVKCRKDFQDMLVYVRKQVAEIREESRQRQVSHSANMTKLMQELSIIKLENFSLHAQLDAREDADPQPPGRESLVVAEKPREDPRVGALPGGVW